MSQRTLYDRLTRKHLKKAWRKIHKRRESYGYDGVTIDAFASNLTNEIEKLYNELRSNKFSFRLHRGVPISKVPGKAPRELKADDLRGIRVPAVRDRVVQKGIELIINPYLDKKYLLTRNPVNFAYVKDKGLEDALNRVVSLFEAGCRWYYKGDISKFFDSIDQDLLLNKFIAPALPDSSLDGLIKRALRNEVGNRNKLIRDGFEVDAIFPNLEMGVPQGGVLSPLFANVYLSGFDREMLNGGFNLIRYADDFVVMCMTEAEAIKAEKLARKIIERDLGLKVHPVGSGKSVIGRFNNITFLGIRFTGRKRYPSKKATEKMQSELRRFPHTDLNFTENLVALTRKVSTWGSTYHFTNTDDRDLYASLNRSLREAVERVFKRHGVAFSSGRFGKYELEQLGLKDFDRSVASSHQRILARRAEAAEIIRTRGAAKPHPPSDTDSQDAAGVSHASVSINIREKEAEYNI